MQRILKKFAVFSRRSAADLDRRLRTCGVTGGQFMYIMLICEQDGLSQESIASQLSIDRGAVARAVHQLEEQGYLIRSLADGQRRQYCIHATDKARQAYQAICTVVDDYEQHLLQDLSREEIKLLDSMMERIISRTQRQ